MKEQRQDHSHQMRSLPCYLPQKHIVWYFSVRIWCVSCKMLALSVCNSARAMAEGLQRQDHAWHHQKHPLRWVKAGWVVGAFVDVMKMWVNLLHFCLRSQWVKIVVFNQLLFQICRFHPLLFSVSPTCRFRLLVDFVFTHFFFPFHPLADFTYLWISPTFRFHPVSPDNSEPTLTCGLSQIFAQVPCPHCSDFTNLQISPTCRFHLPADFTQFHFCQISSTCRFLQP